MKKILILIFCGITLIAKSQNASVEPSIFGIQVGAFGVWVHNESKLSNQIAFRSEIGLDVGTYINDARDLHGIFLTPTIAIEPRWYYNLNKRERKSRRIDGNSGNFISIKTTYVPYWFIISTEDYNNYVQEISIVPTWGIRRNIGTHFMFETGIGIGYLHYFEEEDVITDKSDIAVNIHLRIGYRF